MAIPKNVSFLRGNQQGIYDIMSGVNKTHTIQPGAFYLADDSHRLYYATAEENSKLVALNEGIITVTDTTYLPGQANGTPSTLTEAEKKLYAGQFYYAETENVLCIFNGKQWVQINPDTTINKVEVTSVQNGTNKVQLQVMLNEAMELSDTEAFAGVNMGISTDGSTITLTGSIASLKVTEDATKGMKLTVENSQGGASDDVYFKAGTNVTLTKDTVDGKERINIAAADTKLSTVDMAVGGSKNAATIATTVTDTANTTKSDSVNIKAGTGAQVEVDAASSTITVSANDYDLSAAQSGVNADIKLTGTLTDTTPDKVTLAPGTNISSIAVASDKITINAYDEIVGDLEVTPAASGFGLSLAYSGGSRGNGVKNAALDPTITLTDGAHHFVNGDMALPVYTKDEVDAKIEEELQGFDAMHYMGAVSKAEDLPTSGVRAGDTYKVAVAFGSYERNSILIAKGKEGKDGYIEGTVTWEYIEADTETYKFTTSAPTGKAVFTLNDSGTAVADKGTVVVENGDLTEVVGTTSNSNQNLNVKINHKKITATKTDKGALNLAKATLNKSTSQTLTDIVSNVQFDAYGHVTSYDVTDFQVVDSHANLDTMEVTTTSTAKSISNNITIKDTDGAVVSGSAVVKVDSTNSSLGVNANHEIELVWGTF